MAKLNFGPFPSFRIWFVVLLCIGHVLSHSLGYNSSSQLQKQTRGVKPITLNHAFGEALAAGRCPASHPTSCSDGYCYPATTECCPDGGACPIGGECCGNNNCAPIGAACCGPDIYCKLSEHCCTKGGYGCCDLTATCDTQIINGNVHGVCSSLTSCSDDAQFCPEPYDDICCEPPLVCGRGGVCVKASSPQAVDAADGLQASNYVGLILAQFAALSIVFLFRRFA